MSRFLKIMIVLLTIAAVATPVMAEDRLSLGGQMRVRGWYLDDERASEDYTSSFMDQRLRIGGKLNIAEGVSVTFRFDETEGTWGDRNAAGANRQGIRFIDGEEGMQWDRAHLDITKGMFHLRAGQQFVGFGNSGFDAQDNGLLLDIKSAVPVTLFWMIDDNNEFGDFHNSDAYYFGAKVGVKADAMSVDGYIAGQVGDHINYSIDEDGKKVSDSTKSTVGEAVYVIGANGKFDLSAVKLEVELDYFTGDADENTDAIGTQLFVDASVAASDAFTVGGQLYYALGTDKDDEAQYYCLGNEFGGWDSMFILGTGLDNEKAGIGRPWDLGDALGYAGNTGIMAVRGYASFKASDDLTLSGSLAYAAPEEDSVTKLDSAVLVALGMKYNVMANTALGVQVEYKGISADATNDMPSDPTVLTAGAGLFVNF